MAIFHMDFNIVKRSEGMSSVAKAAYHARCRIIDERTGDTYDYSRRTDLYGHIILAPVNAPAHIVGSSTALWNEVERVERQQNGQTSRYFEVAIPNELSLDDKKKLVLEYCQENFVNKGMIADIVFHDLDSNNPHAHVMLTLKTIDQNGFGKKERSWNDKKLSVKWREAWTTIANNYLEASGSSERIDHRSLLAQHEEALAMVEQASTNKEKAIWLAKATETNRPAMKHVHRAKWRRPETQKQRAEEQAIRDQQKEEAKETYHLFKDLPLEIVVDVRSFTVTVLPEAEEILLSDTNASASTSDNNKPILVAPALNTRSRAVKSYRDKTKVSKVITGNQPSVNISDADTSSLLKTPSSKTNRASRSAPNRVNSKKAIPRQENIFKRFTLLIVDFFREKLIWAKTSRSKIDPNDAEHDKHVAENYVFDEVSGIYVSRAEYEKRAKFNSDDYKPTKDEIRRFPSRPQQEKQRIDNSMDLAPSIPEENTTKNHVPRLRPTGYYDNK